MDNPRTLQKGRRTRVAAYALIVEGGKILLCRLAKRVVRWQGYWTLPGGGVEFGEHPESAMVREVEEETGLEVTALRVAGVDSVVDTSGVDDRHAIRVIYIAKVIGGALRNEVTGSTDACAWFPLEGIGRGRVVDVVKAGLNFLYLDQQRPETLERG